MFVEILEAIKKKRISTLSEISKITGIDRDSVRIAVDYWERKGKLSIQNVSESYSSNICFTCPLRGKCYVCRNQTKEGGRNVFITHRKR